MKPIFLWILAVLFFSTNPLSSNLITVPGSLTHESTLPLKGQIEGTIPIQNDSDAIVTVKITLADYLFNAEGESSFPLAGTCPRSNHAWISSSGTQIAVAPHTTYSFSYKLQVPDDNSLSGTYWSIFLIEPILEKREESDQKQSLGVQTIIRYGVQIVTNIEEKGSYDLKILKKTVEKDGEKRTFALSVENTGTLIQAPFLLLELVDTKGKKVGRLEAPKQRIFPTCSVTYKVDLPDLPAGKYKTIAVLDHGENAFFGAQYELTLD